jgi:hypothetical protein
MPWRRAFWRDIVAQLVELPYPPAARRLRMTLAIDAMEAGVREGKYEPIDALRSVLR